MVRAVAGAPGIRGEVCLRPTALEIRPGGDSYFASQNALRVEFSGGRISRLSALPSDAGISSAEIEPELLANFFDETREKRRALRFADLPGRLIEGVYAPWAQYANSQGYAVFAMDMRGWGQSQGFGRRGYVHRGQEDYVEDLKPAFVRFPVAAAQAEVAALVARITGKVAPEVIPMVATVFCRGDECKASRRFKYEGVKDCRAAVLVSGGDKTCQYGCLGYGTCYRACPFGAIIPGGTPIPKFEFNVGQYTYFNTPYQMDPMYLREFAMQERLSLLNWSVGQKTVAVKCDLCYFSPNGPSCVIACPHSALRMVDGSGKESSDFIERARSVAERVSGE